MNLFLSSCKSFISSYGSVKISCESVISIIYLLYPVKILLFQVVKCVITKYESVISSYESVISRC